MSLRACSNLTEIVRLLQELPTISNLADDNVQVSSADFDMFVRAWFWGSVIVMGTVVVLFVTWVYFCFVCCCFCCGERGKEKKPKRLRVCCGCTTVLLVILALALGGVLLWMEIRFDAGIVQNYLDLQSVLNATAAGSNEENVSAAVIDLRTFERFRHYSSLAWLGFALLFAIISVLLFACAPICKSRTAAVTVPICFYAVIAFLSSIYSGVLFAYLISLSDQCQDIQLQLADACTMGLVNNTMLIQFDNLCNATSFYGFILLILGCGLIVFFILIQTVAAQYAGSLTRSKFKYVESAEMVISAPIAVSGPGVWSAYGAQALLGRTSQAQAVPQTYYPRNPMNNEPDTQQHIYNNDAIPPHTNYLRLQSQRSYDQGLHSQRSYDRGNSSEATNSYDVNGSYDFGTAAL